MRAHVRRVCALALIWLVGCSQRQLIVWADRGADAVFGEALAEWQHQHPERTVEYRVYTSDFLERSVALGRQVDIVLTASNADVYQDWDQVQMYATDTVLFVDYRAGREGCCLLPEDGHLAARAALTHARNLPCSHTALHPAQLRYLLENGQYDCGFLLSSDFAKFERVGGDTLALGTLQYGARINPDCACRSIDGFLGFLRFHHRTSSKKSTTNVAPSVGKR